MEFWPRKYLPQTLAGSQALADRGAFSGARPKSTAITLLEDLSVLQEILGLCVPSASRDLGVLHRATAVRSVTTGIRATLLEV